MKNIFVSVAIVFAAFTMGWIANMGTMSDYVKIDSVMKEVSARPYDWDNYDCKLFSKDAVQKLADLGIPATIVVGDINQPYQHAVVGILFDAQTGEFASDFKPVRLLNQTELLK